MKLVEPLNGEMESVFRDAIAPFLNTNQKYYSADFTLAALTYIDFYSNKYFEAVKSICDVLGIKTKISYSQDYGLIDGKTERLIDFVKKAGGTEYLSGPAAKDYIDEKLFASAGIKLTWMNYSNYREYTQLYPPFEHGVTILDLLFNVGKDSIRYIREKIKGFRNGSCKL